jgi:hypothetical protein
MQHRFVYSRVWGIRVESRTFNPGINIQPPMTQCPCLQSTRVTTCIRSTINHLISLSASSLHHFFYSFNTLHTRTSTQHNLPNMPLVVPGLTSNSGDNDQTNKWMNELVGKKLGDSSNETVRLAPCYKPRVYGLLVVPEQTSLITTDLRQNRPP